MNEPSWKLTARTIVISVLVGASAGVLTSALTNDYLSDYAVELERLTEPLRIVEERPRSVPQSFEEAVDAVQSRAMPALAQFYDPTQNAPVQGYVPFDNAAAVMNGSVLTSDGWIVARAPEESGFTAQMLAVFQVVVEQDVYSVEQVAPHPDGLTFFVKVDAQNLPVMAFGSGWDVRAGDQVFVLPARDSLAPAWVMLVDVDGGRAHPDTEFPRALRLMTDVGQAGSPVVNAAGELIGIVSSKGVVQPIDEMLPVFRTFLRDGRVSIPKLGVTVLDLAHAVSVPESQQRGFFVGALIIQNGVERASAAAQASLRAGDIILSVDGEMVNGERALSERLIEHSPGDRVTLRVDRGGQTQEIEVTLGTLE